MDRCRIPALECTEMSPGLDGWMWENYRSSVGGSMLPCGHRSYNPRQIVVRKEVLPHKGHNAHDQGIIEMMDKGESIITDREKVITTFRKSLVKYMRPIIDPYWREGKLSKNAYKLVLEKSVDKVVQSFGEAQLPSERKIDNYLKSSHMKLSKLLQAYVKKYQKK